jgi:magnesium-protoporphyrin IX monomethyl ester (oxidative) cyclase
MEELRRAADAMEAASARGGIGGRIAKAWHGARAGFALLKLYLHPVEDNRLPDSTRMAAAW